MPFLKVASTFWKGHLPRLWLKLMYDLLSFISTEQHLVVLEKVQCHRLIISWLLSTLIFRLSNSMLLKLSVFYGDFHSNLWTGVMLQNSLKFLSFRLFICYKTVFSCYWLNLIFVWWEKWNNQDLKGLIWESMRVVVSDHLAQKNVNNQHERKHEF